MRSRENIKELTSNFITKEETNNGRAERKQKKIK